MILELIIVRHGLSCANTWKKRLRGIHLLYADPELTEHGVELCEERGPILQEHINHYFPDNSYKVGTSTMIRTQQTAYHMLLKGTEQRMTILPHIAETGITTNNYPLPAEVQRDEMGPSVSHHIEADHRGKTDYFNKSDWNKFLNWVYHLGDERERVFHKTDFGVYCGVIFTHGHFMRQVLKVPKIENNDMFYVQVDVTDKRIVEQTRLTKFPAVPAPFSKDTDSCRIRTYGDYLKHTLRTPVHRRRRTRKNRKHN
jgi:broad specificity phosphatase PhoE